MIIRDMAYDDITEVVKHGKLMHAESSYKDLKFNDDKCINLAASLINSPDGFAVVAEEQGVILGVMAGILSEHWFSSEIMASDYIFYVHPDYRGSSAAVRMITKYQAWAIVKGAKTVTIGISAEINNDEAAKLCEHLGMRRSAILMRMDI